MRLADLKVGDEAGSVMGILKNPLRVRREIVRILHGYWYFHEAP